MRREGDKGTRRLGDKGTGGCRSFVALFFLLVLCAIIVAGCGEGSPFEPQDSEPVEIPGALLARQFPTGDGCSWEYISSDGNHTYTTKIAGTKNIGGFTTRIRVSDSEISVTQLGLLYGLPIRNSFFTKDLDSVTEHAFDLWLISVNDNFFQRNSPKRVLWSFPLYAGKEWTVSKSYTIPEILYIRKVVSDNNVVSVPAGTFRGVYCVEEYASFANLPEEEELPPSKYWLAPDVGVVKYEYPDPFFDITTVYELNNWEGEAPVEP